jgi:nitrogen regulatory protein PII-like uncharacterized protein
MDIELKQYLDEQFKSVATKVDLEAQTRTLRAYADEQTEKLALIIATTIVEPMERNFSELKDYKLMKEEFQTLKTEMQKIKTALQLN